MSDYKIKSRLFFERMGEGWSEVLEEIFSDEIKWVIPKGAVKEFAGVHFGKKNIIAMMSGAIDGSFKPGTHRSEILLEVAERDYVVVEAIIHGEILEGGVYQNTYAFIFRFDEHGKICELREHVDTVIAQQAFSAGE